LYGRGGRNFVDTILDKANRGEQLKVVDDQIGRPTFAADLSEATVRLLDAQASGIIHFANNGQCSWHEFAVEIVRQAGLRVAVGSLSSRELARPAKRPAYSVLDLSSYEKATSAPPRHWKEALADYMHRHKLDGQTT
jgi:dTDP-4-dehydrorhamnose reductase